MKVDLNELELFDCIYTFIRVHEESNDKLNINSLNEIYKTELNKLDIDKNYLNRIIEKLIEDNIIYKTLDGYFKISPSANNFMGYKINSILKKREERGKNVYDKLFKIIPIIIAFIFGTLSFILGVLSYTEKANSKKLEIQIDSLTNTIKRKEINLFNYKDSVKLENSKVKSLSVDSQNIQNGTKIN